MAVTLEALKKLVTGVEDHPRLVQLLNVVEQVFGPGMVQARISTFGEYNDEYTVDRVWSIEAWDANGCRHEVSREDGDLTDAMAAELQKEWDDTPEDEYPRKYYRDLEEFLEGAREEYIYDLLHGVFPELQHYGKIDLTSITTPPDLSRYTLLFDGDVVKE